MKLVGKILGVFLISAALVFSAVGCSGGSQQTQSGQNQNGAENENGSDKSDSAKSDSKKDNSQKISVKNLNEQSKPIGVSEITPRISGPSSYVTFKVTKNDSDVNESIVSLKIEVLDSKEKILSTGTVKIPKTLTEGDSYTYDGYLGYCEGTSDTALTARVAAIEEADAAEVREEEDFKNALFELSYQLEEKNFNKAAILWEDIMEEYGDSHAKELRTFKAEQKDKGCDLDNLTDSDDETQSDSTKTD